MSKVWLAGLALVCSAQQKYVTANGNMDSVAALLLGTNINPICSRIYSSTRLFKLAAGLKCRRTFSPRFAARAAKPANDRGSAPRKTPKSAVVVMPPSWEWDDIQELREFHDKGFYRWMPHINLLYPFYEDGTTDFKDAISKLESACRTIKPFELRLSSFDFFEHGPKSSTIWLKPESANHRKQTNDEPLRRLHGVLLDACPECDDLSNDKERGIIEFSPHLSVGQWRGTKDAVDAVKTLAKDWSPLEFTVDSIYIISRTTYSSSFDVRWKIPLGPSGKKQLINQKYIAVNQGSEGIDKWKFQSRERPAADQSAKYNTGPARWGLFEK